MTDRRSDTFAALWGRQGWGRGALGALAGILLTGLVCRLWLHSDDGALPFLIAPMGATAVLLFAVPASPLAQPWAVIGGNMMSALVGHAAALLFADPVLGAAVAVSGAIMVMSLARCLHPPGGAVALTAVIGGPAIAAAGWSFAFIPVGLNSALMVGAAWLYHRLTRHVYPHRMIAPASRLHGTNDPPPLERIGFTTADINTALADHGERLDVSPDDLETVFRRAEARAHGRRHRDIRCTDIMSRDIVCASPGETIDVAHAKMQALHLLTLPVVASRYNVIGIVEFRDLGPNNRHRIDSVMRPVPAMARPDTPIDDLLPLLASGSVHQVLVTLADNRLAGMITQTDLLAALWQADLAARPVTPSIANAD